MNPVKTACYLALFCFNFGFAQKSEIYTTSLKDYNHAVDLYQNSDYVAAQIVFNEIAPRFSKTSEIRANIEFYKAFSAIKRDQFGADGAMDTFVSTYATSLKSAIAYLEVGNYYFNVGKYNKALKWFSKVAVSRLNTFQKERLIFNKGYALFIIKKYKLAKTYFANLLNSKDYGEKAMYYYGYIAYADKDYDSANKYLSKVSSEENYASNVAYYLADINFKTGHFKKAISIAVPLLKEIQGSLIPQLSKIIGESYFNLKNYSEAIPYLLKYKGVKGQWNNNDYYQLGYAYYKLQDYSKAISWFNKIVSGTDAVAQNASYHLADCYLKTQNKTAALNAFRKASQMDFSPEIKEDAFYNYAKLSYDIGNPYNNVAQVLINFLKAYPNHREKESINTLLINAFMRSKDYKGALSYFKNLYDSDSRKTYQKAAYYYGVQLFLEPNYNAAIKAFSKAINVKLDNDFHKKALFWRGETHYRLSNYSMALNDFNSLKNLQNPPSADLNYSLGYTHFKRKEYTQAITYFKDFISGGVSEKTRLTDAYLRLGDSYFATSRYTQAISTFKKVSQLSLKDADYARYQIAMSYGFLKQNVQKNTFLKQLIAQNKASRLYDDALFELGNTYLKTNQDDLAIQFYDRLLNTVNRSPFKAKALLKEGLIYYNKDNPTKALIIYKRLVEDFNNAPEARQAVKNAKEIYSDLGQIDVYEQWVKNSDIVAETDESLDKAMYQSAEKFYLQNKLKKATLAFKKYLTRFPKGIYNLEAHFYSAQSFLSLNEPDKAQAHLEFVVTQENALFTEEALSKLALLYLKKSDWENATPVLIRLENEAEKAQNILFAQSNLMKAYFAKNDFDKALAYAEKVLQTNALDTQLKADAHIIIARSAIKTNHLDSARKAYEAVEKTAGGKLKAEALYYKAYFKTQDKQYKSSNKVIQNLASNYAAYKEFGAKGLVLMAQNFYGLKDAYQATYILESVLKNFTDYPDVINEANTLLKDIKAKEAQTNTSVKQDN
jgi:tetratricopeptide (TPR) repeat protein